MTCACDAESEGGGGCNCDVRWPRTLCPSTWSDGVMKDIPELGCKNLWSNIILRQFSVFEEKALILIQGRPLVRTNE